jgi:hypothetical protein
MEFQFPTAGTALLIGVRPAVSRRIRSRLAFCTIPVHHAQMPAFCGHLLFPILRRRISFSFLSTAISETIVLLDLKTWRKTWSRGAKKSTMSALEMEGSAFQSEISAHQRLDGISPPHGLRKCFPVTGRARIRLLCTFHQATERSISAIGTAPSQYSFTPIQLWQSYHADPTVSLSRLIL